MSAVGEITKNAGFVFKWHIECFSIWLTKVHQVIVSPVVSIEQLKQTDWKLSILIPDDAEENFTLILKRDEENPEAPERLDVDGKLFIAKNDGTCIFSKHFTYYFQTALDIKPLIISRKVILEDSKMFLPKNTLTVGFQFFTNPPIPIECIGRSYLFIKNYSINMSITFPETTPGGGEQTIVSPIISSSNQHPQFRVYMICKDSNHEIPITVTIEMHKFVNDGCVKGIIIFSSKESVLLKAETGGKYEAGKAFEIFGVNVSRASFHKHSLFKADNLKCELMVWNGEYKSLLEKTIYKQNTCGSCRHRLDASPPQNFMELYDDNSLCDFKIIVPGREFLIHKIVLAAASPVFRAMFESCMVESEKSQVTIVEFSIGTIERLLQFAYTGTVKDLAWDDALQLYAIAHKYQIRKLKIACYNFLKSALRFERLLELLIFISPYDDAFLYKIADDFICANSKDVFESEDWINFKKNNVQIACATMYRICQSVLQ